MKQGWEVKTLGELAHIKGGKRVPKGYRLETKPTNYPYIRVTDFNDNGSVDLSDIHFINEEVFKQIKNYTISTKDLYISIAGTIGKTGIIPEELDGANLTENACKLVFRVDVDPKLVYYFTKTEDFLIQAGLNTRIAAMPKLALTRLSTISLFFPKSLPEQQRIVAILDEAFAAIAKAKANAQQNLKNAKELFESYLQSVFENKDEDWVHTRLGDICLINDGTHFSPKNTSQGEYMYVTAKNIKPYFIDLTKISYISEKDHKEIYARCSPVKGDVLYIKDGATAGIAALNTLDEEFSLLSSVALLKCSSKILNTFLVHYMNSLIGKKNFLGYIDGAAITRLTLVKIKNVCFSLPPLETQQTIVQKLDALSAQTKKLEAIYQQHLNDLDELKKSVLQKAFRGELHNPKGTGQLQSPEEAASA